MADTANQGTSLSLVDLNTSLDNEPRLLDVRLAEALGFEDRKKIRYYITRNIDELRARGGEIPTTSAEVRRTSTNPKGSGRGAKEYWLNEPQAVFLCAACRMPNGDSVRRALIDIFVAHRAKHPTLPRFHGLSFHQMMDACSYISCLVDENDKALIQEAWDWAFHRLTFDPAPPVEPHSDPLANMTLAQRVTIASYAASLLSGGEPDAHDAAVKYVFRRLS